MKISKRLTAALLCLSTYYPAVALSLSANEENAKAEGIKRFNQLRLATPYLQIAADTGDAESQFYLAEQLSTLAQYVTPEAERWYLKSATQGNLYAMAKLSTLASNNCVTLSACPDAKKQSEEWKQQAIKVAVKKASERDSESMYVMYSLTGDLDWLTQSANAGNAKSLWLLASKIREGRGFFISQSSRDKKIHSLMEQSALRGYPKGMMGYAAILQESGDSAGFRLWAERAAEAGYIPSVYGVGYGYAHEPDSFGFPYDPIKGYALLSTLLQLDGGGGTKALAQETIAAVQKKMTPEQIEQSRSYAAHWSATHAPLSYYNDPLGY
ncbi:sel1 repeat family protein [Pseudomonas sp.]|uniref:sel1 repeat family protein n=1 Tax=Pseudomonas sp. TaxID=306 RepID=UPI003CC5455A